jgi:hypothetical protein
MGERWHQHSGEQPQTRPFGLYRRASMVFMGRVYTPTVAIHRGENHLLRVRGCGASRCRLASCDDDFQRCGLSRDHDG